MKISKVVRRKGGDVVSALNAVITANVGETDQETSATSRQHVEISSATAIPKYANTQPTTRSDDG